MCQGIAKFVVHNAKKGRRICESFGNYVVKPAGIDVVK